MVNVSRFKVLSFVMAFLLAASLFAGCLAEAQDQGAVAEGTAAAEPKSTDYSAVINWMTKPAVTRAVDTFYIYPTAYIDMSEGAPTICDIDDPVMRQSADALYEKQAIVYAESTNVFAPYYRQVNMAVAATAPAEVRNALLEQEPKADLFAALDYYFEHFNNGRPFILAGHSQGSQMMTYVLSEYRKAHEDYFSRMVAAYALGYSITGGFLAENPGLSFAEGPDDTGVIVSWNTEGEGNRDQDSFVVEEGAIAINPLNWRRDETYAGKEENLGARILNEETGAYEIIPEAADAVLDTQRGVVVTHTDVMEPMDPVMGFGPESYHGGDYDLWYSNIQENVRLRVERYLNDHPAATDYAQPASWYKVPEITKEADTFFIYPTVYGGYDEGEADYAPLDDAGMAAGVETMYQMQACVFEESTNLFMPYYRQASMRIEVAAHQETGDIETVLSTVPLEDITAALDYYFENFNGGRPFIIAGHSQGAAMTRLLLKTYFKDHPEYYERMVAAYVIGYSVTREDLEENPHLKFATGEDDVGVIVSWNIEGPKNADVDNLVVLKDSVAINPLNWKLDGTYAPASENLGSRILNAETGEYEIVDIGADARLNVDRGVVVTNANSEPITDMTEFFGPQSFHNGDYPFYFMNIQDNVAKRIAAWPGEAKQ